MANIIKIELKIVQNHIQTQSIAFYVNLAIMSAITLVYAVLQ